MTTEIVTLSVMLFMLFSIYSWALYLYGKASAYRDSASRETFDTANDNITVQTTQEIYRGKRN